MWCPAGGGGPRRRAYQQRASAQKHGPEPVNPIQHAAETLLGDRPAEAGTCVDQKKVRFFPMKRLRNCNGKLFFSVCQGSFTSIKANPQTSEQYPNKHKVFPCRLHGIRFCRSSAELNAQPTPSGCGIPCGRRWLLVFPKKGSRLSVVQHCRQAHPVFPTPRRKRSATTTEHRNPSIRIKFLVYLPVRHASVCPALFRHMHGRMRADRQPLCRSAAAGFQA